MKNVQKRPKIELKLEYRQYYLDPDFPVQALLSGVFNFPVSQKGTMRRMHLHNAFEIGYNYNSNTVISIDGREEFSTTSGDVVMICPFTMHGGYVPEESDEKNDSWEYIYVDTNQLFADFYPMGAPFLECFNYQSPDFPSVIPCNKYSHITDLVREILDELRYKAHNYEEIVKAKLLVFFLECSRMINDKENKYPPTKEHKKQVFPVVDAVYYINEKYYENLSCTELAEICHTSVTNFRRLFKSCMGCTPMHYLDSVRISRSCKLLYETDLPILDIAMKVGFNSISSYNRNFASQLSTSPSKWRSSVRNISTKDIIY